MGGTHVAGNGNHLLRPVLVLGQRSVKLFVVTFNIFSCGVVGGKEKEKRREDRSARRWWYPRKGSTCRITSVDLLVSLQGSPGAKVENGGFEC